MKIDKITWDKLLYQKDIFSLKLKAALKELNIDDICYRLEIDHMCVRLKDIDNVVSLKQELEGFGSVISSSNVNGREIITVQLNEPLDLGDWKVYGVELPYPKVIHNYLDGWEHVEFVLPYSENTITGIRAAFLKCFLI